MKCLFIVGSLFTVAVEVDVADGLALFLRQAVEVEKKLVDDLGLLVGVFFLDVKHKFSMYTKGTQKEPSLLCT